MGRLMNSMNLFPWRHKKKQQEKQTFLLNLMCIIIIIFWLAILWHHFIETEIQQLTMTQNTLQAQNNIDEKSISFILQFQQDYNDAILRTSKISSLEHQQHNTQQLIESFSNNIPAGVMWKTITIKNNKITFLGITENNTQISTVLERFKKDPLYSDIQLVALKSSALHDAEFSFIGSVKERS
jgi:Tfp pilus assembly protein PilN